MIPLPPPILDKRVTQYIAITWRRTRTQKSLTFCSNQVSKETRLRVPVKRSDEKTDMQNSFSSRFFVKMTRKTKIANHCDHKSPLCLCESRANHATFARHAKTQKNLFVSNLALPSCLLFIVGNTILNVLKRDNKDILRLKEKILSAQCASVYLTDQ